MDKQAKSLVVLGIAGLQIVTILNLIAQLYLQKTSAMWFTSDWWSLWFPNYVLWFVFWIVGVAQARKYKVS